MDLFSIVIVAISLAMDCFSVSIANGLVMKHSKFLNALKMASSFGFFQSAMFVIGYLSILSMSSLISEVDHWMAFSLLLFIGGKMIYDSLKNELTEVKSLSLSFLLLLSVATSIDSLGVGVSYAVLQTSMMIPMIIIGIASFLFAIIGVFIGERFGRILKNKIEIFGGIVLIGIGVKMLIEHLTIV